MTVLFHDIHKDENLNNELEQDRVLGAMFDEILYADDTIIHSTSCEQLTMLLHRIQIEGEKYGLKLNHDKCEAMAVRGITEIYYLNGENKRIRRK